MRKVTKENYRKDPCHGRMSVAVSALLKEKEYAAPVELFQKMELLTAEDYRNWGKGANIRLRFSRSGERKLEEAWARHYVRTKRKVEVPDGEAAVDTAQGAPITSDPAFGSIDKQCWGIDGQSDCGPDRA